MYSRTAKQTPRCEAGQRSHPNIAIATLEALETFGAVQLAPQPAYSKADEHHEWHHKNRSQQNLSLDVTDFSIELE